MNLKIYELVTKILESDLPKETKDEIVRFYTLPRNTPVKPLLESPDEDPNLGSVKRPTARELHLKKHPKEAGEQEVMTETLDEVAQ